ncbi:uncharacterized protein LOC121718985 isoform X1 [Alosa sapidissima]|uniref:uncharacterized protein LOC121718985 isoform X1 n=1 Tax=Alosa sapidissima TaxID=34773 RepID=UPI001C09D4F1|nr:uncharacterized protein LOC121718985 isoform X1 [Alosa sapidissima]
MALEQHEGMIRQLKEEGKTYDEISNKLLAEGVIRGASVANLKKFCKEKGLVDSRWGKVSQEELQSAVWDATGEGARNLNPVPYRAEYFGEKLHMDQNEKLVMFGVTHAMAIDGYSGKLVGHSTMPVKNNLVIYEEVYRKAVLGHGLWDQVRTDRGREFYLCQYVQEKLAGQRYCTARPSFLQTPSTLNHRIERLWSEVNTRVNFPIKACLQSLTDQGAINMEDDVVKFCTSQLACQVASVGLT